MAKSKKKGDASKITTTRSKRVAKALRKTKAAKAAAATKTKKKVAKASLETKATKPSPASKLTEKSGARNAKTDAQWDKHLEALKDFKTEKGHTLVPKIYKDNQLLAYWVQRNRKNFILHQKGEKSTMTLDRVQRLRDVDFCFRAKGIDLQAEVELQRKRDQGYANWTKHFNELCEYKQKNGNCLVPKVYTKNKPLASWVYNQRYQYKKRKEGANTVLDDERIKKLEEVGFCWRAKADETWKLKERAKKYAESQASWDEKYEMLLKYKNKHGNCLVPKIYKTSQPLSSWVFRQRRQYVFREAEKHHTLGDDRLKKLEKIGFVFKVKNVKVENDDHVIKRDGMNLPKSERRDSPDDKAPNDEESINEVNDDMGKTVQVENDDHDPPVDKASSDEESINEESINEVNDDMGKTVQVENDDHDPPDDKASNDEESNNEVNDDMGKTVQVENDDHDPPDDNASSDEESNNEIHDDMGNAVAMASMPSTEKEPRLVSKDNSSCSEWLVSDDDELPKVNKEVTNAIVVDENNNEKDAKVSSKKVKDVTRANNKAEKKKDGKEDETINAKAPKDNASKKRPRTHSEAPKTKIKRRMTSQAEKKTPIAGKNKGSSKRRSSSTKSSQSKYTDVRTLRSTRK